MTKLFNSVSRKGIFAVAAVALVSTTGAVAFAQAGGQKNQVQAQQNGYGNHHEQAVRKLRQAVSTANWQYLHGASHAIYVAGQQVTINQAGAFNSASISFLQTVLSAQGNFNASVNSVAATATTPSGFNSSYNQAQSIYSAVLDSAAARLVSDYRAIGIRHSGQVSDDLDDIAGRLTRNLDRAQAVFARKLSHPMGSMSSTSVLSSQEDENESAQLEPGKYDVEKEEFSRVKGS